MNYETVIATKVDESGVTTLTVGNLVSLRLRQLLTATLRNADPEAYARYKAIRGPKQTASLESRRAALAFAISRVGEVALQYFARFE